MSAGSGKLARGDDGSEGMLAACLAAGITAFAIGMFTFDAFSFIQVTFLSFILIGIGSVLLGLPRESAATPIRAGIRGLVDGRAGTVPTPSGRA